MSLFFMDSSNWDETMSLFSQKGNVKPKPLLIIRDGRAYLRSEDGTISLVAINIATKRKEANQEAKDGKEY